MLRAGRSRIRLRVGVWDFLSSPKRPDRVWGPSSLAFNGYRGSFQGVKRLGRAVDHSPPSSAEVNNEWSCTSTDPIRLHGVDRRKSVPHTYWVWCLTQLRNGFAFTSWRHTVGSAIFYDYVRRSPLLMQEFKLRSSRQVTTPQSFLYHPVSSLGLFQGIYVELLRETTEIIRDRP